MGAEIQSNDKKKLHFLIQKQLEFGKAIYVIGNIQQLGNWKINNAYRLSWNKNHYWTGFIELPAICLDKPIQYKYIIANWHDPYSGNIQWQAGQANRHIQSKKGSQYIICENVWNMQKITLNLIVPEDYRNQQYFVTGDCKQLGNWRKSLKLKLKQIKKFPSFQKLKDIEAGKKYLIYTITFQIFRGKSKINYCYIRKGENIQIQRQPGRKYELSKQLNSHRNCIKINHTSGDTQMFQTCGFNQLYYSTITNNILLGPYLQNSEDFKLLRQEGVTSIVSIQTSQQLTRHYLTKDFLHHQSLKFGMQFYQFEIEDMNKNDFLHKYEDVLILLKKLINQGKKVYIHCTAGVYRSPQIVALFLIINQNYSVDSAISHVKAKHPFARLNTKIISHAIQLYEKKNIIASLS